VSPAIARVFFFVVSFNLRLPFLQPSLLLNLSQLASCGFFFGGSRSGCLGLGLTLLHQDIPSSLLPRSGRFLGCCLFFPFLGSSGR
jgi:hypothetical protein